MASMFYLHVPFAFTLQCRHPNQQQKYVVNSMAYVCVCVSVVQLVAIPHNWVSVNYRRENETEWKIQIAQSCVTFFSSSFFRFKIYQLQCSPDENWPRMEEREKLLRKILSHVARRMGQYGADLENTIFDVDELVFTSRIICDCWSLASIAIFNWALLHRLWLVVHTRVYDFGTWSSTLSRASSTK